MGKGQLIDKLPGAYPKPNNSQLYDLLSCLITDRDMRGLVSGHLPQRASRARRIRVIVTKVNRELELGCLK